MRWRWPSAPSWPAAAPADEAGKVMIVTVVTIIGNGSPAAPPGGLPGAPPVRAAGCAARWAAGRGGWFERGPGVGISFLVGVLRPALDRGGAAAGARSARAHRREP